MEEIAQDSGGVVCNVSWVSFVIVGNAILHMVQLVFNRQKKVRKREETERKCLWCVRVCACLWCVCVCMYQVNFKSSWAHHSPLVHPIPHTVSLRTLRAVLMFSVGLSMTFLSASFTPIAIIIALDLIDLIWSDPIFSSLSSLLCVIINNECTWVSKWILKSDGIATWP